MSQLRLQFSAAGQTGLEAVWFGLCEQGEVSALVQLWGAYPPYRAPANVYGHDACEQLIDRCEPWDAKRGSKRQGSGPSMGACGPSYTTVGGSVVVFGRVYESA